MFVLLASFHVRPEHVEQFIEAAKDDARHSFGDEPGCHRFDVIQDRADNTRVSFYEVYQDEAAFEQHKQMPHFARWRKATESDWYTEPSNVTFFETRMVDGQETSADKG
jgi:quinol monooxygenase YgiN